MATKSKIEAEIKKFKNILSNDKKSDFIKKKAKTQIKKLEDELAKIGSKVVKGAKKLADMTDEEFAKEKKKLENKLGKTEEECENILKEYKEQRAKAGRQRANEKKRVATMQKKKETTTPTSNEKNLKTILSDNADKVDDKLDKEVNNIKSEAKREAKKKVADKNLTTAQKQKKIDEIVQFEVKKKTKAIADKVALETKSVISAISVKLSSIDKQLRLTYLRKVKAEVESMISKMMFGGLTDGATQNLNVTQSQMSAESVNPQMYAKGGNVSKDLGHLIYVSNVNNPNPNKELVAMVKGKGDAIIIKSALQKNVGEAPLDYTLESKFAKGGKTKGLEHFLRNADKITTKDGKVVSKSEFIKKQKEKEDFEKGLDDLYPNLSDDYKKGKFNKGGGVENFDKVYEFKNEENGNYTLMYENVANRHKEKLRENKNVRILVDTPQYFRYESGNGKLYNIAQRTIAFDDNFAKGGKTWIDSGKNNVHKRGTKGTFRAKAEKKGMTSGEYARKVLKDPKSTKAERKSAQFVENIGVKEEGGEIMTADTQMEFADGGRLFDDLKINKGAFTKKAKQRGLSTQDFMRKVLANPSRYDERTRKQAQLMKNMQ